MKKLTLLCFIFLFPLHAYALFEEAPSSDKIGIFSTLEKINKEKTHLSEKEGQLGFEKQSIEQHTKELESIDTLLDEVNVQYKIISSLSQKLTKNEEKDDPILKEIETETTSFISSLKELLPMIDISFLEEELSVQYYEKNKGKIEKRITEKKKILSSDIITSEEKILIGQEEIKTITDDINKSEIALQIQTKELLIKVTLFVGALFFLFFFAKILQKIIKRKDSFSEEKRQVLLSIVRWIRNIIIFSLVVFFFFSEFLTILPFLAILGTALGFALRDVISSFIAWFVIGLKDGIYTVGDVIEIEEENVFGRIVKITPLITQIQELGLSGPNGMYRSFPNKKIFERSIKNVWKQKGWIFISTDFILEAKSDVTAAKKLLLSSLEEVSSSENFTKALSQKTFLKKFGHTEDTLRPQVFLEIRPQGVLLRGKVPVMWSERHMMRTGVVEVFTTKARKNKQIFFRYIEIGGNFMSGKN